LEYFRGGDATQNNYFVFAASATIAFITGKCKLILDGLGDIDCSFFFAFTPLPEEKGQMSRAALAAAEWPYEQKKQDSPFQNAAAMRA
jgi:hypothetical protein